MYLRNLIFLAIYLLVYTFLRFPESFYGCFALTNSMSTVCLVYCLPIWL